MPKPHPLAAFVAGTLIALAGAGACADEGGKSLYLLGKRGPLAGLIPKPGWYITDDVYYQQLTADSGSNLLGDFKGRVAALGPELGYQFKAAGGTMGLDLRWYHEFAAQSRVEGDAVFLTLSPPLQRDSAGAGAR